MGTLEVAVQFAMWGTQDGSVAIRRTGFYSVDYALLPLDAVAGKTRVMEDEFISASGTDVTEAFRMYLRPLLGSGMPDAYTHGLSLAVVIIQSLQAAGRQARMRRLALAPE